MRRPDEPPEISDEERARIRRAIGRRMLWGGIAFLAVVVLGMVPGIVNRVSPAAARVTAVAAWIVAPLIAIAVLVVAALKLRR